MTPGRFTGRVAAITGAASGMGRALAVELARRGCHLALADIDAEGLAETARQVAGITVTTREAGVTITTAHVDTADRAAVFAWAADVVRDHGRVNLVFNNAGVALGAAAGEADPGDFAWVMGVNFWGVVWGTQAFLPHLEASGDGHVVNTSSVFGLLAMPLNGAYNASKFAVRGYTEALRMELDLKGGGVSATCVHPGGVRTRIAVDARLDPRVAAWTGQSVDEARRTFDKLLDATTAEAAALRILAGVERNERRVLVGRDAWWADKLVRVFGSAYQRLVVAGVKRQRARARRAR